MSRILEDELGLPPMDNNKEEKKEKSSEVAIKEAQQIMDSLSASEKIDAALPTISGLQVHDSEMDDISRRAISTYEDLVALGSNSPVMYSCKVYEVAGQVLKTAMDARDSKINKKIKMLELQMKKMKLDEDGGKSSSSDDGGLDRNEILKMFSDKSNDKADDK